MGVMKAFQARLLDARELAGLSQTKAAEAIGETLPSGKGRGPTVYEWEKGKRVPSADQLAKLVDLYGVSGHWLLTGEGPMRPDQGDAPARLHAIRQIADGEISPEDLRAVEELRRLGSLEGLPEEMRQAVAEVLEKTTLGPSANKGERPA